MRSTSQTGRGKQPETDHDLSIIFPMNLSHRIGPPHLFDSVALDGVHWFNQTRLLQPIGLMPPKEFEALYERSQQKSSTVA